MQKKGQKSIEKTTKRKRSKYATQKVTEKREQKSSTKKNYRKQQKTIKKRQKWKNSATKNDNSPNKEHEKSTKSTKKCKSRGQKNFLKIEEKGYDKGWIKKGTKNPTIKMHIKEWSRKRRQKSELKMCQSKSRY